LNIRGRKGFRERVDDANGMAISQAIQQSINTTEGARYLGRFCPTCHPNDSLAHDTSLSLLP
jgi:hypothetical protein